jgi:MFS family permease
MKNEKYAWFVVAVLVLANVSSWIDRQILNLLAPAIRADLGISMTEMGLLIGLPFSLFFAVMGFPIARLADRSNRRNIIAIGITFWSLMTALCGLAGGYSRLMLARIGVGVGEASLQGPGTSLIADYFPRERFSTAMGFYAMASFIGAGLAYMLGGWVIGIAATQETWTLPVVGTLRLWQVVFLFVGLPGLLVALLMLAVREPPRTTPTVARIPYSSLFGYMWQNARTFSSLIVGYGMSLAVNIGIAAWLATFFIQKLGWTAARAGIVMGILTITIGPIGAVSGGRLADALIARGRSDAALRVGILASLGMLVVATAYPFAPTPALTVILLGGVNFFAALPWGAGNAGVAMLVPAQMRAQGIAIFVFGTTLISAGLGPVGIAAITEYVFREESKLPYALATVNVICMTTAIVLFTWAMPAFRRTLEQRDQWQPGP